MGSCVKTGVSFGDNPQDNKTLVKSVKLEKTLDFEIKLLRLGLSVMFFGGEGDNFKAYILDLGLLLGLNTLSSEMKFWFLPS